MKIFQYIKDFTNKISLKLLKIFGPRVRKHRKNHTSTCDSSKIKQKVVRKRKSFASFLKQNSSDMVGERSRYRLKRGKRGDDSRGGHSFLQIQKLTS